MAHRIAFFAESSRSVGVGHAMRSSVLAEHFHSCGWSVDFYSNLAHAPWVTRYLKSLGINYQFCLSFDLNSSKNYELIIVDTYSHELITQINKLGSELKIITIEDASTPKIKSDFKVIQSLDVRHSRTPDYSNSAPKIFGPRYCLIRKQIKHVQLSKTLSIGNVLVLSGGSDLTNFKRAVFQSVIDLDLNFNFHFIADSAFFVENLPPNIKIHPQGTRVEQLKIPISFAISLAGVSAIELVAARVPTILGASVENQLPNYHFLTTHNFSVPLEIYKRNTGWTFNAGDIENGIEKLNGVNHFPELDFEGARRIYDEISKYFQISPTGSPAF